MTAYRHRSQFLLIVTTLFLGCAAFSSYAVAGGASCSNASTAQTGGCVAYEHADFNGMRQDLGPNKIFNYVGDSMNDKISSFRVSEGCYVIAWEHRDRGGASKRFDECQYIGDDWNDRISSWECKCQPVHRRPGQID